MKRERVFDWQGGPLQIVRVLEGPTGPLLSDPVEVVECLPLPHGLALPVRPVPIKTREGEPVAEIDVGVVAGHAACVAIRAVGEHALTTLLLRDLPGLGKVVRRFVDTEVVRVVRTEDGEIVGERYVDASDTTGFDEARRELLAEVAATVPTPTRRPQTITPEFLREVAETYREARATDRSTTRAIEVKFQTSESNARRWVALARAEGVLGKAPSERRGGELARPKRRKGKS